MVLPFEPMLCVHFRKGNLAVWATKMLLNTHLLYLSAKLLTFNPLLVPFPYLDDIVQESNYK